MRKLFVAAALGIGSLVGFAASPVDAAPYCVAYGVGHAVGYGKCYASGYKWQAVVDCKNIFATQYGPWTTGTGLNSWSEVTCSSGTGGVSAIHMNYRPL